MNFLTAVRYAQLGERICRKSQGDLYCVREGGQGFGNQYLILVNCDDGKQAFLCVEDYLATGWITEKKMREQDKTLIAANITQLEKRLIGLRSKLQS